MVIVFAEVLNMDYEQDYLGPNSSSLEVMIKEEEEETMDPLYQKRITLEHRAPPPAAARPPPVATGSPANAYLIQRCVLDHFLLIQIQLFFSVRIRIQQLKKCGLDSA